MERVTERLVTFHAHTNRGLMMLALMPSLARSLRTVRISCMLSSALLVAACETNSKLSTIEQIPALMRAFDVDGLAVTVVQGEEALVSESFGITQDGAPFTTRTSCGLFSATKILASLTYANLNQNGKIDLDKPIGDYLPDAPEEWKKIPFFRLLNHTAGLPMIVNNPRFGELIADPDSDNRDIYQIIRNEPLDFEPGEHSRYQQSGYAIGEVILNESLETSFDSLVETYIIEPAGMVETQNSAVLDNTQPPLILSAGGYQTTIEDMARLFLALNSAAVISPEAWADLLLNESYVTDGYSLGNIIERRNDVLTLGHRGGGARANIRYAPNEKIGVMICTDDVTNNSLSISIANMLIEEVSNGVTPKMPLFVALSDYKTKSGMEIVSAYKSATLPESEFDLSDSETLLNEIGYTLLFDERPDDAIEVFSLNTQLFPGSPNTFDSLGEALLTSGNLVAALDNYRKALQIDPESDHARRMTQEILSRLKQSQASPEAQQEHTPKEVVGN